MPPAEFRLHNEAADEIRAAIDWYMTRSNDAAQAFLDEFGRALDRILADPAMGAPYLYGTREVKLHRFRYVTVYKEIHDIVHVVALSHTSRRPGYWKDRLGDLKEF